ncbi:MAG: hypothetical protein LUH10_17530 [Tannerellaceae bacterium]|nr:hypothetical protein [Tannerellaceae bacterium]
MKKVFFYLFLVLGCVCTFTSCDNDDENDNNVAENTVVFGNQTFKIKEAWLDYDGYYDDDDEENTLVSMDIDFDLGEGSWVSFALVLEDGNTEPKAGTYTFDRNPTQGFKIRRGWFDNEIEDADYEFISGSCEVSKSGNTYTFNFSFICYDNSTLKGKYTGTLKNYDDED